MGEIAWERLEKRSPVKRLQKMEWKSTGILNKRKQENDMATSQYDRLSISRLMKEENATKGTMLQERKDFQEE